MNTVTITLLPSDEELLAKIIRMRADLGMPFSSDASLGSILYYGMRAELRELERQQTWAGALAKEQAA